MKKHLFLVTALCVLMICGCQDEGDKDMEMPEITEEGITACPVDCEPFVRGDTIHVHYLFSDNAALGNFNIEIHHNFDHHTHSTSSAECEREENKTPVNPWVFNQDYAIPADSKNHETNVCIPIPADIDPGDYHFMIRLTDRAGWQQLKAVAIKVIE